MPRKKTATRRGNNEGCISKRPDGRWIAQVTLGYDVNGKRIRLYRKNEKCSVLRFLWKRYYI